MAKEHDEDTPKRRSGIFLIIGAILLVIGLIAAGTILISRTGDEPAEEAQQTAAPAPRDAPSGASAEGQTIPDAMGRQVTDVGDVPGAPLEQTGQPGGFPEGVEPVGPPAGLELQRVARGVTVGVSTSDGPTGVDEGVLTGFSRSARGAGLLAMNYRARVIAAGPEYIDLLKYYFPASHEQLSEEAIAEIEGKDATQMEDYMSTGYLAPAWLKFRSCDETFCTVETAEPSVKEALGTQPEGVQGAEQHTVTRVSMEWRDDRWNIVKTDAYNVGEIDDGWEKWL